MKKSIFVWQQGRTIVCGAIEQSYRREFTTEPSKINFHVPGYCDHTTTVTTICRGSQASIVLLHPPPRDSFVLSRKKLRRSIHLFQSETEVLSDYNTLVDFKFVFPHCPQCPSVRECVLCLLSELLRTGAKETNRNEN